MAQEEYALAYVEVDGVLQLEEADVTINRDPKLLPQYTVAKRLAGVSPGAGETMIDVQSAVPVGGFETDPGKYFVDGPKRCQVRIVAGLQSMTVDGWITKDNFRHGVNKEATINFSGIFELGKWVPLPTP
jgi:hypothetical protein